MESPGIGEIGGVADHSSLISTRVNQSREAALAGSGVELSRCERVSFLPHRSGHRWHNDLFALLTDNSNSS